MQMTRFAFWLLLALAVVQAIFYYPRLPDRMAAHFDSLGRSDGWMSKEAFFAVDLGVVFLTALIFLGISWLARTRRGEGLRSLHGQMIPLGCATLVVLLVAMQWAIQANLDGSETLPSAGMWWLLGGYLLFTAFWILRLVGRFRRTP